MSYCIHHPDRETRYQCQKHQIFLCEECLQCRDPELYCKFRQSCPIWFMHKEALREHRQACPQPLDSPESEDYLSH